MLPNTTGRLLTYSRPRSTLRSSDMYESAMLEPSRVRRTVGRGAMDARHLFHMLVSCWTSDSGPATAICKRSCGGRAPSCHDWLAATLHWCAYLHHRDSSIVRDLPDPPMSFMSIRRYYTYPTPDQRSEHKFASSPLSSSFLASPLDYEEIINNPGVRVRVHFFMRKTRQFQLRL